MKSSAIGASTSSNVEIANISRHGVWVYVTGNEYFLAFEHFPWFKTATIAQILDVELLHARHLYWRDLDVDLELEALKSPEKYPLVYA